MTEAVIVEAVRTPIGRRNGWLSTVHAGSLLAAAQTGDHRVSRSQVPGRLADELQFLVGVGGKQPVGREHADHLLDGGHAHRLHRILIEVKD